MAAVIAEADPKDGCPGADGGRERGREGGVDARPAPRVLPSRQAAGIDLLLLCVSGFVFGISKVCYSRYFHKRFSDATEAGRSLLPEEKQQ